MLIARTWHGVVPADRADEYFDFTVENGVRDYKATPGNKGVFVLRRIEGDEAHFLLMTLWDSYKSIESFAGGEIRKAKYYPEDPEFLKELEPFVTHYDVLMQSQ